MNHCYIDLADAPKVAGLRFREFESESDYPEMAPMLVRAFEGDGDYWTVDALRHLDSFVPWVDPAKDRVIVEVHGKMIGAGRVQAWKEPNAQGERVFYNSFNMLPEWRGKGIGTAVLHHNERRLREIANAHPPDEPRFFQTFPIFSHHPAAERLVARHGYAPIRYFHDMVRSPLDEIPDFPLPAGVETRAVETAHMRTIWDCKEEAFRDHWGAIPQGDRGFDAWSKDPFLRKELSCVAWDGEQCVGMVLIFVSDEENQHKQRNRAYTELINVRRPWRNRGVASALIAQSLRNVRDPGFADAGLSVDTENASGALRLYERLGYRTEKRSTFFRKPM